MPAYLMVRATVQEADRSAFDHWYETEHLPDAKKSFGAISAHRGWLEEAPELHVAFYEFSDLSRAKQIVVSDELKAMVAEFDRVWLDRVQRTREVFEVRQAI